ncbi:MAG: amino-acid N-acetyltransferase [Gammaproteobacteria bacterium]|nr:amino-acid N-acetyltransferase [Gammaproteobacteria bacterium]
MPNTESTAHLHAPSTSTTPDNDFIHWFRNATPYINTFRGRTFVITFGGEMLAADQFPHLVEDLVLLNSLGVKLVLVFGARPQIEHLLKKRELMTEMVNGIRLTDDKSLVAVRDAVASVRVEIESRLSMGMFNTPMAGSQIKVISGNFVTAKPVGVRDGIDYLHTGEVRRIDHQAISHSLDNGAIVLLSPLGYSPTGEIFNLSAEDVATFTAASIHADKIVSLIAADGLFNSSGELIRELRLDEAEQMLQSMNLEDEDLAKTLFSAIYACNNGVKRAHIINRNINGGLLLELFTRDGIGTLISPERYEIIRQATADDVVGILELIAPLEDEGILVRRSRDVLETEIDHFTIIMREKTIIACAALYPYAEEEIAEVACVAVHPDYRRQQRGDQLLQYLEKMARKQGLLSLFVLTTHTAQWFQERGFHHSTLKALPINRQQLYNYQRRSRVFTKSLQADKR